MPWASHKCVLCPQEAKPLKSVENRSWNIWYILQEWIQIGIYLKGYLWFFQVVGKCPVTLNLDSLWALNKQNCQYVLGLRDTFCRWLGTENKYEISSLPEQFVHPEQHKPCVGNSLCHLLCCNSLLSELYVLQPIFVIFLSNRYGCPCCPFWWCFGRCPSGVSRSRERLSSVHFVFSSCALGGLARVAQAGLRLWGGHSLPAATVSLQCSPGSTERATESCRGKGLKGFPFTLCKYTGNTWKRKGCQECCWEEGQLFVFCPPTEYNLFKYLHVLLLKDFLFCAFLVIKLWMVEMERFVIANSSTCSDVEKKILLFYLLR